MRRRPLLLLGAAAPLALRPGAGLAHGFRAGGISIDHPYAPPTPPGARNGALYFRHLHNQGEQDDMLLSASSEVAERIEIHRRSLEDDVMRMRAVDTLPLPAGQRLPLRHGGELHLMLLGLRQPLRDGARFRVRLHFQHAGAVDVVAWVQQPRAPAGAHAH